MSCRDRTGRKGSLLLEATLALAIFSLAATGLVMALQQLLTSSTEARIDAQLRLVVENLMAELEGAELSTGTHDWESGHPAIGARVEFEPYQPENLEGFVLEDLYLLSVEAFWMDREELFYQGERYVYRPE